MITKAIGYLRKNGLRKTALRCYRAVLPERINCLSTIRRHLAGKRGLEIGGPTPLFQGVGLIPVYRVVAALDNANFSTRTVWEGELKDAGDFVFDDGRKRGVQFVREAGSLQGIADASYDFILSSHVIEHLANPLAALREWLRVLKPGGAMLTVMPHREGTFDHRRPVTPLSHLIDDMNAGTGEDDLTHLAEILSLHDLSRDPGADPATFEQRCRDNFSNRCLHQHVFDTGAVVAMLNHIGLRIVCVEARLPYHICVLAEKPIGGGRPDNSAWLGVAVPSRHRSPFKSDRA